RPCLDPLLKRLKNPGRASSRVDSRGPARRGSARRRSARTCAEAAGGRSQLGNCPIHGAKSCLPWSSFAATAVGAPVLQETGLPPVLQETGLPTVLWRAVWPGSHAGLAPSLRCRGVAWRPPFQAGETGGSAGPASTASTVAPLLIPRRG